MGCLKSLIHKIIFIALLTAFFCLGGWAFVKKLINDYKYPPREVFIQTEANYADFSKISSDYQLSRSFNLFGYKKINAKYLPTNQKITIIDEDKVKVADFKTGEIEKKISNLLDNLKDSIITFDDFKILQKGNYIAGNKTIPYIKFGAKVKNVPFKNVIGVIACYNTINKNAKNPSSKLILTIVDSKAFNPVIISGFVQALRF